jgi:two-component system, sensor histidine kinase and response regulator
MGKDTTAVRPLILVIEDEEAINENICEILKHFGYRVLSAYDGYKGLDIIRAQRPDLVLCDIMMPNLDGVGLLRELRSDVEFVSLPFIFLTAKSQAEDILTGLKTGADDYLPKPFETKELIQAVEFRLQKNQILLQKSKDEAKMQYLEMASRSSHEIGNILNGLLNGIDILLDDLVNQNLDDIDTMLALIKKAGVELHTRYHNLETVHSIFTGTLFRNVDKSSSWAINTGYVGSLVKDIAKQNPGRLTDVNLDMDAERVSIYEDHLRKVLSEIIQNAFQFSKKGDEIRISGHAANGVYKITVMDAGPGMDLSQVDLSKFLRDNEISVSQQFGMGLGLYISNQIVEFWNGSLSLFSEPGKGTLVIISLPITGEPSAAS